MRLIRPLALLTVAAATAVALAAPATAPAKGRTVCQNVKPGSSGFSRTVTYGQRKIARVWFHETTDGGVCVVLRALAFKGTPHYMLLRVCDKQVGPLKGKGCTEEDAGRYRFYAGPISFPDRFCPTARVIVEGPGGRRFANGFVLGPCT